MNKKKRRKRLNKAIKMRSKARLKKAWKNIFIQNGILDAG